MKKIILSAALLCSLGINAQNLQLRKLIPSENILIGATVNQWLVASDLGLTEHQINDPSYQLVGSRDQMKIEMGSCQASSTV